MKGSMKKMTGQILTLGELNELASKRKSVYSPSYGPLKIPKPAAFVMHWPGVRLLQAIDAGLFEYPPRKEA